MKRIFLAAVFVAAASGASMAQSTKVTCHLKASNSEWLPRVVELTLTGDKIVVTDEAINGFKFLRPIKRRSPSIMPAAGHINGCCGMSRGIE